MGDVRLAMDGAFESSDTAFNAQTAAHPPTSWRRPIPAALLLLAAMSITGLAVWVLTRTTDASDLMGFRLAPETVPLRVNTEVASLAIAPDGSQVIYVGTDPESGVPGLWVRAMDQLDSAPLRGGEGALGPFVSPDGAWVGFGNARGLTRLQKVAIGGGPPVQLTEARSSIWGASWGANDQIVFGTRDGGLYQVSGAGGDAVPLTAPDPEQDGSHHWPSVISDREAVVFVIDPPGTAPSQLAVLNLATRAVHHLGVAGFGARYLSTGHLVYVAEDGSLQAPCPSTWPP